MSTDNLGEPQVVHLRLERLEDEFDKLSHVVRRVDEIYTFLAGDQIRGEPGLVARVEKQAEINRSQDGLIAEIIERVDALKLEVDTLRNAPAQAAQQTLTAQRAALITVGLTLGIKFLEWVAAALHLGGK